MTRSRPIFSLPHFTTHDFRRTCASGLARLGVLPHVISLVLDHISASKSTVTGAVYVKYSYDHEKREALQTWANHLKRIFSKPDRSLASQKPVHSVPARAGIAAARKPRLGAIC